ncbi:hypothetical protein HB364_01445 [Pseudoflavitalea sp. X16]|uniref:DUF6263 family protein n=1 Tax=Paraflavitalea devenefica TaxID=2716334 RepID=UPI00141E9F31|nr:DUF6263 family protein [Paraflavitalea devenefica]NII23726.1 hypothetical protein [Paraflavitalea devenefica]
MKKLLFIPLALSTVFVSAQSLSRKAVFAKGQQLERVAAVKMNFSMEMMGQAISFDNNNTITSLVEVKNATAKDYAIESTVKRVVMSMSGMGQEMNYDSDKKEETTNEMTKKMKEMVGKVSHLTVDTKGIIVASDDTSNAGEKADGFMGMANSFANTGHKPGKNYDLVADLPEKAVKAGDTWADSSVSKEGKTTTNYKVLEVKGAEAIVDLDGTMTQSGETEANGMTVNLSINGKIKGQYTMDVASGIIKKRIATMDATGTMDMAGQSIPFTMKVTMDEGIARK